jgi:VanZ family protein
MTRHKPAFAVLLLILALGALLVPLPVPVSVAPWRALVQDLENFGHPLTFALLGAVTFGAARAAFPAPAWRAPLLAVLVGLLLGAMTEWLQTLIGRDGSWEDIWGDMLGCVASVAWLAARSADGLRSRLPALAMRALSIALAVIAIAPLCWTLAAYATRAQQAPVFWRHDSRLLQRFSHVQQGRFPALVVQEPPADWSGFRALVIEVVNPQSRPVEMALRVHDREHDETYADRFNAVLRLSPGPLKIRVPLDRVRQGPRGRQMDMQRIRGVAIFVASPELLENLRPQRMYLEQ